MHLKSLLNRTKILSLTGLFLSVFIFHNAHAQMRQVFVDNLDEDNHVNKISFYTPSEGYVAFTKWIGYTTDSGRTFERKYITMGNVNFNGYDVNLTFGFGISGVKAFSKDTLLAYGDYGAVPAILYSTNGGSGWVVIYHTYLDQEHLSRGVTDMLFPGNGNIGYAVEFDRILKSTDRGKTWSVLNERRDYFFDHLEAVDDNTAFAYSTLYVKALVKITGGVATTTMAIPEDNLHCLHFLTTDKGWLNSNGKIFYTTNAGTTWKQMNNIPVSLTKMKFLNDSVGYAIDGRNVLKTTDSGKVWEKLPRDIEYEDGYEGHLDLSFWNANQFWAGGGHGLLEITTNGGGIPIPTAGFTTDTAGLYNTKTVKLTNYSKPAYSYKWFKNDTLVATTYNAVYTREAYPLTDTVMLVVSNGTHSDTAIQYLYFNAPVDITSFTPTSGASGATITIRGENLSSVNAVYFGGSAAQSFQVISDTEIRAVVLLGSSGAITVVTPTRGIDSHPGFTFIPAPVIQSITPMSAKAGQTVTISGYDLNGATEVRFAGVNATSYTVVNSNTITAVVPPGVPGIVNVRTPGGLALFNGFVILPDLISFTPDSGTIGTVLNISGTSLSRINAVTVGGMAVQSFTVHSASQISAVVSTGASGNVVITSPDGADTLGGFTFYKKPVINNISPTSGPIGTSVTITGIFFDPVPANNIVYFGNLRATVTAGSETSLTVTVPVGTMPQPLSVTTNNRTAYSKQVFNVTFAGGGYMTPNSLTRQVLNMAAGTITRDIETGDIDGDGKTDLVLATFNNTAGSISIARNTSSGATVSFATPIILAHPAPKKIALGDVDGDGKADIAVTDSVNNTLTYFRNTSTSGNISFAAPMVEPTLPEPRDLAITDFDGDGKADILVSASGVIIYRNTSSSSAVVFDTTIVRNAGGRMVLNDFDQDGKPDILSSGYPYGAMAASMNTSTPGAITFGDGEGFIFSERTYIPGATDLNGDGYPDVVAADLSYQDLLSSFFVYDPSNSGFSHPQFFGSGFKPRGVAFSDLDGDNKPDVLVTHPDYHFSVYRNISEIGGFPTFELPVQYSPGNYSTSFDIDIADIDGDGKPDPVLVNGDGSAVNIYLNKAVPKPYIIRFSPGTGTAGASVTITGRYFNGVTSVSFGGVPATSFTINSDTSITATVGAGATGKVYVTNSFGTDSLGTFIYGNAPVITSVSPRSGPVGSQVTINGGGFNPVAANNLVYIGGVRAAVNSVNGNSITATVPPGASVENISVTVNQLTAYSRLPFIVTFAGDTSRFTTNSFENVFETDAQDPGSLADLNGDGKQDLVLMRDGYAFSVRANTSSPGNVSFAQEMNVSPGNKSVESIVSDLDGDGKMDVVVLDGVVNSFGVFRNTSTAAGISFAPRINYTIGIQSIPANSISIADFDGDGRPDIAVSNFDSHVVSIFKNQSSAGNILFVWVTECVVAGQPLDVKTADVDGDGKTDIAVGVFYVFGRVGLFRNTSTSDAISFAPYHDLPAANMPRSILLTDYDGNNRLELTKTHSTMLFADMLEFTGGPGTISWEGLPSLVVNNDPLHLASGDLDGDGRPELVVSQHVGSAYSLFRNTSSVNQISFADSARIDVPGNPNHAILGDIDGDGVLDIVCYRMFKTIILRNLKGQGCTNTVRPQVNITTANTTVCAGTSVSFTATAVNGGANPGYQWFLNGNSVGTNSNQYTTTLQAGVFDVRVVLTSSAACVAPTDDTMTLFVMVNAAPVPAVSINASTDTICTGNNVTFTAVPVNGGTNPVYQWKKNGVNVGTNNPVYSTNTLATGDSVTVTLTSNAACAAPAPVTSRAVRIIVETDIAPLVVIAGDTVLDQGEAASLSAVVTNLGGTLVYQWQDSTATHNWSNITGATTPALSYTPLQSANKVRVLVTGSRCGTVVTITSRATSFLSNSGARIVPNPVATFFNIQDLKLTDKWEKLEIADMATGRIMWTENITNKTTVLLSAVNLPRGMYVAILKRSSGPPAHLVFVK